MALTNVVKMLLVKENEVNQQPMQSISTVTKTETMSTTTTTSIMGEMNAKTENRLQLPCYLLQNILRYFH